MPFKGNLQNPRNLWAAWGHQPKSNSEKQGNSQQTTGQEGVRNRSYLFWKICRNYRSKKTTTMEHLNRWFSQSHFSCTFLLFFYYCWCYHWKQQTLVELESGAKSVSYCWILLHAYHTAILFSPGHHCS